MRNIFLLLLTLMPIFCQAQNVWEVPTDETNNTSAEQKVANEKKNSKRTEDPKYLVGAVPEVNGKVVFTLDKDVPGMSAEDIYKKMYELIQGLTKEENQFDVSKIAVVNKQEHTIAARMKEWLVFKSTFISLDRTIFNYTLIAKCTPGHVNLTLERINYQYEIDRGNNTGLETNAEEWITDKYALNKSKTKLLKYNGKFRTKTIERKDNIFQRACNALGIKYE